MAEVDQLLANQGPHRHSCGLETHHTCSLLLKQKGNLQNRRGFGLLLFSTNHKQLHRETDTPHAGSDTNWWAITKSWAWNSECWSAWPVALTPAVWDAPQARSGTLWEPTSSTQAEVHRPGQTEGGTAAEKLVKPGADIRPDYKDGGVARGLGKLLAVLIKVQDWPMTTANNSIQDIPEFNREMEEKAHLDSKQQRGSLPRQDGWNNSLIPWAPEQIR